MTAPIDPKKPPIATRYASLERYNREQHGAAHILPSGAADAALGFRGSNRSRGSRDTKRSSPSVQAIEPETGTCSLGQDGRPKTPGTSWRPKEIARLGPAPFREIP